MRYRRLGPTGLFVSELCFGTMTFGGKGFWEAIGSLGAADAESLVAASLDAGVNFFDTADVYSEGESETLLGGALASLGRPREEVVVATKVRGRVGAGANQVGLSRSAHPGVDRRQPAAARSSTTSTSTRSTASIG
jgi:aryl-alcohol dehydrogenase-like predicted oxidoreductase